MRSNKLSLVPLSLLAVAAVAAAFGLASAAGSGTADAAGSLTVGKAEIASMGALELGPDGVLFVGDSEGAAVWALDVEPPAKPPASPVDQIEDLDGKIAARLGISTRDLRIHDMAVHKPSGTAYLSVTRGSGDSAQPVLLSVARDGAIAEVSLEKIAHAKVTLDNAPAPDAVQRNRRLRTMTITDLELVDGELLIAGLSNEEFASTLRRVPYPFSSEVRTTGLEIYHGAHAKYETHAPIFAFTQYELNEKPHLLAGYLCTPLVTFPLEEVREKERLRGKTIAELGWGNIPTDILPYEYDGSEYVLVANTRRGTMKIKRSDIEAAQKKDGIATEAGVRAGVDYQTVPLGAVLQIDDLDDESILVLGRSIEDGSLYLQARSKQWL